MRRFLPILLSLFLVACGTPSATLVSSSTSVPPTRVPQTLVPPTRVPQTLAPPTRVPPISASPTRVPPTRVPPTRVPPTSLPPTSVPSTPTPSSPVAPAAFPAEILFVRQGDLLALDPATGTVRSVATEVSAVAATPDGRQLALVRNGELWVVSRDGTGLQYLAVAGVISGMPAWAADGSSLAYTVSQTPAPVAPDWLNWSNWCSSSSVYVLNFTTPATPTLNLGAGCEPSFSPDGRRIAFTAPPRQVAPGTNQPSMLNALRIVNRQGANGWDVAQSMGGPLDESMLVYSSAWSPDGQQLAYQRFVGYQLLSDLNLTEASSAFARRPAPLDSGAGWLLPPHYAPDGSALAVTEHNYSDARGFTGYDIWTTTVLTLGVTSDMVLPAATVIAQAERRDTLRGATAAAWAPDGRSLAVVLPQGWRPDTSMFEPAFPENGPGELWLWIPGTQPQTRLVDGLDFGTPLLWVPAMR